MRRLHRSAGILLIYTTVLSLPCAGSDWVDDDAYDQFEQEQQQKRADRQKREQDQRQGQQSALDSPTSGDSSPLRPAPETPDQGEQSQTDPNVSAEVTELETSLFGQSYSDSPILERLNDLEVALGLNSLAATSSTLDERIARVRKALEQLPPSAEPQASAPPSLPKRNWFLNPAPMPALDPIGRKLKSAGKGLMAMPKATAEGTKTMLKSPLFWGAAAAGGLAVGGYFLLKNTNNGPAGPANSAEFASSSPTGYSQYEDPDDQYSYLGSQQTTSTGAQQPLMTPTQSPPMARYPAPQSPLTPQYPFTQSPGISLGGGRVVPQPHMKNPYHNPTGPLNFSSGGVINTSGSHYVSGYTNKHGTYVQGHYQTNANHTMMDNWSTKGNINPFTGKRGTKSARY